MIIQPEQPVVKVYLKEGPDLEGQPLFKAPDSIGLLIDGEAHIVPVENIAYSVWPKEVLESAFRQQSLLAGGR